MNNLNEKRINRRKERQLEPINSIEAFEQKYSKKSKIYESLIKLELSLYSPDNKTGIDDPIEYLHYLYYDMKLGSPKIFEIVGKFFHYKEYSKINFLFREIFGWKIRKSSETIKLQKLSIEKQKKSINNIEDYQEKYYNLNTDIYESLVKLEFFLLGEDNSTGIYDPIEYLHHLYYNERLGAPSIFKIVGDFFHYKDYSKLNYLFRKVFGWDLRGKEEKTTGNNHQNCDVIINKARIKREKENTKKMINDILGGKQIEEIKLDKFSFEVLDTVKYKKEKMLKILSIISGEKEEKIKNIILKTRDNKNNKTGATQIAKKIQNVLDTLGLSNIEINRHLIQKM